MDSGVVKFILLKTIGDAYVDRTVTEEEMKEGFSILQAVLKEKKDDKKKNVLFLCDLSLAL
mgnify:CR=1 FL=1